jgi:hypothetical protein
MRQGWAGLAGVLTAGWLVAAGPAQAQYKQWDRRFGGGAYDTATSAQQTSDGGYVIAGFSRSLAGGDKSQESRGDFDFWMVKVDANGNKQWDRRFGGTAPDICSVVQQTPDGGYILGGTSASGIGGDKTEGSRGGFDYWIVKVDATGNKQWDRRFGGSANDNLTALRATPDGGYILAGFSASPAGGDKTHGSRGDSDYWIVKTDAQGRKQWDRTLGGSANDFCSAVQPTPDGGYLVGGYSWSNVGGDKTENSRGQSDYWIVKLDVRGRKQWDRTFGGSGFDNMTDLQPTADGGYVLGGTSSSGANGDKWEDTRGGSDYWLVKVRTNGTMQWNTRFGGTGADTLSALRQTADGGYILGGSSDSPAGGDKTEGTRGGQDFWIVKTDADGNKRWDRRFGGGDSDMLFGIQQTVDGGYFLAGQSDSPAGGDKTQGTRGDYDFWIVKLDGLLPDAYEPDDSGRTAKPIANGRTQRRNIHEPEDIDYAVFAVGAGGAHNVRVETWGPVGDTELRIINQATMALAAYNDDISPLNKFSRIGPISLPAGHYWIAVNAFGNNMAIPGYSLRASWTQVVLPDRYEPDNRMSAAKTIRNGQTQQRTIHRAGNRDWAKFRVGRAGARDVAIETRGTGADTELFLYNSNGRRLAYDDDSGPNRFSRIRRSRLPAGTYFIRVQEKGNDGTIAAYTLRARWRNP